MLIIFAAIGAVFSGISTFDFIVHLDRQIHPVTCSFIPGLGAPDTAGTSGCYAVMMSAYSSVFRDRTWGGVPIALASLSVFVYLIFMSIDIIFRRALGRQNESAYCIAATSLPMVVSLVYLMISISVIGDLCESCVGIYIASLGCFIASILAHREASRSLDVEEKTEKISWLRYGLSFFEGVAFVTIPIAIFLILKPAYTEEHSRCGELINKEDKYGIRLKIHSAPQGAHAIELVDPLCPACKSLRDRLAANELIAKLDLDAVVFPLDKECNWMVNETLHPGACAVSEAMLCADKDASIVLDWAFDNNEELREIAAGDPSGKAIYKRIKEEFPSIAHCVGKPAVKSKVNRSLRWIVSNAAPVTTPQIYINGKKICDEDTDLGLEYVLKRLLKNFDKSEAKDQVTK